MILNRHATKRCLLLAAAALLIPQAAFAGAASSAKTARAAIAAIYKKQDAAIASKDVDRLLASYGTDYVEAHHEKNANNAVVTRAQLAPMLKNGFTVSYSVKRTTTITSFSLEGTRAHVGVKIQLVVSDSPHMGSAMQMIQNETATDTWVKSGKTWQLVRTDITGGGTETKPLKAAATH
jgi:hypothetical protein